MPQEIKLQEWRDFERDLEALVNKHSMERCCDIPDFVIARHLTYTLVELAQTVNKIRELNNATA